MSRDAPAPSPRPVLRRGDLLPRMRVAPPGPIARANCQRLAASEAPGINTLYGGEDSIQWLEALGANVVDIDGNRYIDLTAGFGVAAIGHRHPLLVEAIGRQSGRLLHGLGDVAAHPSRIELAERLSALAPFDDSRVYFAVSGADAVEIAIKTALLHQRTDRLLVFDPAYHGLTAGALAATSRPAFRRPFSSHLHEQLERLPFGADLEVIASTLSADHYAAVVVEPIVGREGVLLPPTGWLAGLARLCRQHRTLLIVDEIFTGFGRAGTMFVSTAEGAQPDLVCCGKALGGGLPIGVVLGPARLMSSWQTAGEALHTATFVGHPLACAAALATLEVLEQEHLIDRAARLGEYLADRLADWPTTFDCIDDVRGRGLLFGIELGTAGDAAALMDGARRRGVLLLAGGPSGRVAQITPPLTISERQLEHAIGVIETVLEKHDGSGDNDGD